MRTERLGGGLVLGALAGFLARDLELTTLVSYWGDKTILVVLGALVGVLLAALGAQRWLAAATLALAAGWLAVVLTPVPRWLSSGLRRDDAVAAADAVFVLASDIQPDGDFTAAAEARLVHGLELIAQRHASRLILSELGPPHHSYAEPARALAANLGLTPELISVGPVASTRDEAVAVAAACRERGLKRLLVVTSPLHSRRASQALEHEGLEVLSSPAAETRYDIEGMKRPADRLFTFGAALHERVGLWLYARRGWITSR